MITEKFEQALYIRDLITEKKSIITGMSQENYEDLWVESAYSLPDHFHSEMEPNYMELLMGLSAFECQEDAPFEEIDKLRQYINSKVDEKAQDNLKFLELRLKSVSNNIKYLKGKFKKDWKQSYKDVLKEMESAQPDKNSPSNPMDMDDILDKISRGGMGSLTDEEKKFLKLKGGEGNKDK